MTGDRTPVASVAARILAQEPETFTGHSHECEFLVTRYPDGSLELATRLQSWETWSAPVPLRAVKA